MTIPIPEHLERFVHDQVQAGRYSTEDEVISDALERLRQHTQPIASEMVLDQAAKVGEEMGHVGLNRLASAQVEGITPCSSGPDAIGQKR